MTTHAKAAYKRLAQKMVDEIQQGQRQVGEKMPSLRRFASQHGVSMTTAIRCYEHLEDLGYVNAIEKSGFYITLPLKAPNSIEFKQFNSEITALPETDFLRFGPSQNTHNQTNKNTGKNTGKSTNKGSAQQAFGTAQSSPESMPIEALQRCINRVLRQQNSQHYLYGDPQGSETLRQALASHFSKQGFGLQSKDLMITNGCMDAVALALEAVTEPGDAVAVTSPCFNGLLQLLALMKRPVIELPSTPEGLDLTQLEKLAEQGVVKACLMTSSHQNPSGHSLNTKQKQWLAEFASRFSIPLIEDDVFGELCHQGPIALPIKAWDSEGWVIWCSSASKTLAPGLRLGWCQPGRFLTKLVKQGYLRSFGVNQPLQEGLAEFIDNGQYTKHLKKINLQLRQNMLDYHQFLISHLPDNVTISTPVGGMVMWIHAPGLDSEKLAVAAQAQDIAIRPGSVFSCRHYYQDHFRINIGWPLDKQRQEQLGQLCGLVISLINPSQ